MSDLKAEESAILKEELRGLKAINGKDIAAIVSSYAPGAVIMPPNAPAVRGTAAIRKFWAKWFTTPAMKMEEMDLTFDIASGGDLAYGTGKYRITSKVARGRTVTDEGKFVDVWKRRPRAGWQHALSMFSSDLPANGAT